MKILFMMLVLLVPLGAAQKSVYVIVPPLKTEVAKVATELAKDLAKRKELRLVDALKDAEYTIEVLSVGRRAVGTSRSIIPGNRDVEEVIVIAVNLCMPAKAYCAQLEGQSGSILPNTGSALTEVEKKIRKALED